MLVSRSGHEIDIKVDTEKVEKILKLQNKMGDKFPKFGILVLSYNASDHIESTIARIPKELESAISEIFVFDDCSPDGTFDVAASLKKESFWKEKLNVYKNPRNLRYGGNQKVGYRYASKKGMDYVIMLHGDGQYAPEYVPDLMLPALEDAHEVVFASRMMKKKDAIKGGMPLYKFAGNQVLTKFENIILGTSLYEFHSGYRMYSTKVLDSLPLEENTDHFHFDTQIIIQCRHLGITIKEVPIKTYYGDEECNVDGFQYAFDVCKAVLRYRLHQLHLTREGSYIFNQDAIYTRKKSPYSSHQKIVGLANGGGKLLEIGAANGFLNQALEEKGFEYLGIDNKDQHSSSLSKDKYLKCELENLDGLDLKREYDYVIAADILESIQDTDKFLNSARTLLKENGSLIVSVPNIVLWIYRLSVLIGRFNYSSRGILDRTHIRFFTKFSIIQLLKKNGFAITAVHATSLPFEVVFESSGRSRFIKIVDKVYSAIASNWQKMFAYEFVIEAQITRLNNEAGEGKLN